MLFVVVVVMRTGGKLLKRIPLLPSADMPQASDSFVEGSLGHLLVEISLKMEKKVEPHTNDKKKYFAPCVDVKASMQSVSEHSTVFPCEAVTRSAMTQRVPAHVEQFHLASGHEGVMFFSDDHKSLALGDVNEKADQALLHQFRRHYSRGENEFIEYHLFENQRRNVFLEWASHHLMKFERPAYTEESGTIACPFTNHDIKFNPPDGYEWLESSKENWLIDKDYTATDADGWSYGTDFGYVMQNLKLGTSATTAQLRSVRRRRWKRIAIRVHSDVAKPQIDKKEEADIEKKSHRVEPTKPAAAKTINKSKIETFHVFYNQRRAVLTLSFGPGNLFLTDRHAFTDDSGQLSYPHCKDVDDLSPPTGYEWLEGSKWHSDLEYTQTDEFGWSYG